MDEPPGPFSGAIKNNAFSNREGEQKRLIERLQELTDEGTARMALKNMTALAKILAETKMPETVKDLLTKAEVICTVAGLKPASYLQPIEEKKTFGIRTRKGLTKEEVKLFGDVLKRFGIDYYEKADIRATDLGVKLITIYNKNLVMQTMKNSTLFNAEEIELAEKDFGSFEENILNGAKSGYSSAYRVGVIYGYPLEDVKDHIRELEFAEQLRALQIDLSAKGHC